MSVCFMNHLVLDRQVLIGSQRPPPPSIDTCQNSNIETPGHVHLVLEHASYLKATDRGADIFVVAW